MGEEKLAELEAMMAQGASLRCLVIWIAVLINCASPFSDIMSKFMAKPAGGEGGGGELGSAGGGGGQGGGQGGDQVGDDGGLAKEQEQVRIFQVP